MSIRCASCNKLIKNNEYVWYDETEDKYYDYDCFYKLNFKNDLICGKLINENEFKLIPLAAYGAGPIPSEWFCDDVNDILEDNSFCCNADQDFYNHLPVFIQDNKIYSFDCYRDIEDKKAQCFVLLEDNKFVRDLNPVFFKYSNINFNFSVEKINFHELKLNISIDNQKNSSISSLRLYIFRFSDDIHIDEEYLWALEDFTNLSHLVYYEELDLGVLNKKDSLEDCITLKFKDKIKMWDIAFESKRLNIEDWEFYKEYGINDNKELNCGDNLNLYVVATFITNYGYIQSHEEHLEWN